MRLRRSTGMLLISLGMVLWYAFTLLEASAQSRTETNCNFGMVKGQANGSCQVPIPSGCTVAKFPDFDQRWVDVSKGGKTSCRFDEKKSDWKTTIIGTCDTCSTERCSARFSVMFNCAGTITPPTMQRRAP